MDKIDVLLVNPPSPDRDIYIRDICRWGRKSREGMVWPQTSLAYLAAMVPEGMTVEIIDAIAERITWDSFKKIVGEKSPSVYASYITGTTFPVDARGIQLAKRGGAVTVGLGTHPSAIPVDTLERIHELDIVIRHEPEMTFKEILDNLRNGKTQKDCLGIAFRDEEGRIVLNSDRPLLESLDDLPRPRYSLLPLDKYWMPFLGKRYVWVLTNRGCPFHCTFCFEGVLWGKSVRYRSPGSIFAELVALKRMGVRDILFMADLFTYDRKGVMELCDRILEERLEIRWVCNSRVDTIDAEMAGRMKAAGCWLIAFGIESGSQEILDRCQKEARAEKARETIAMVHSSGIKTWGYFMFGLPHETQQTIRETKRLAKALPLDLALFHVAVPYPGTLFYSQAVERGWLKTFDWTHFDMNDSAVVEYPGLKREEILRETRRAYRDFYFRPVQLIRLLRMLSSWLDILMLFKLAHSFFKWVLLPKAGGRHPQDAPGKFPWMVREPTHTDARRRKSASRDCFS